MIQLMFGNGLSGRMADMNPFLSREKRLRYATFHKNWTEKQWQQDLWSDESKFASVILMQ